MRSRYMMLGALRLPLLLLTVLRPGVKDRASAGAPPDNSACLLWSSSNTTSPWKPGSSQETSMSVCRVVSLMTSPPGVEVGKVEGDACYFTARGPATAVGAGATCANGTTRRSTPPCDQWEIAAVNPRCRKTAAWASYTGAPGVFSADAVVAGFRAGLPAAKGQCGDTGALLGVCLAPPSAIEAGAPGKVFLTGPRKGQCCWNAGFKEHCAAGQVQQARPTPARAAAPHPPSSICVRLGDWSRAHPHATTVAEVVVKQPIARTHKRARTNIRAHARTPTLTAVAVNPFQALRVFHGVDAATATAATAAATPTSTDSAAPAAGVPAPRRRPGAALPPGARTRPAVRCRVRESLPRA